jgi:hypothetical protein
MVRPEDQAIIQYFKNEAGLFRDRRNSADLYDNEEKAYNVAVRSAREVWNVLSQQSEEQEAIPGTQGISSSGGSDPGKGKGVTRMASEAIFFKGQVFDATKSVAVILAQANESIVIVDGYISEKVLDMLTCKPKTASVKILTKDKSISPVFKRLAADFIKQYGNLEIRTSEAFHDRFIIVDDRDFYHLGASIKDAGKKGSMLSHIEQPSVIHDIRVNWAKEWASAKVEL